MSVAGIGRRIERVIAAAGAAAGKTLSETDFGILLGRETEGRGGAAWTQSTVSDWKRERSRPTLEALYAMQRITGLRVMWIAYGEEPLYLTVAGKAKRVAEMPPRFPGTPAHIDVQKHGNVDPKKEKKKGA